MLQPEGSVHAKQINFPNRKRNLPSSPSASRRTRVARIAQQHAAELSIDSGPEATDHIIVRWLAGTPVSTPLSTGDVSIGNNTYDVDLAAGVTVTQAVNYYSQLAGVDFAQPDYIVSDGERQRAKRYVPQLPMGLDAISTPKPLGTSRPAAAGSSSPRSIPESPHDTDLAPNLVTGYNFVTNTTNTADANGHGTNVAGIIGAVGNNGIGMAGVDWNVEIMPLEFMDASGNGLLSNAISAINYAVAKGAKIINNSWGGGGYDAALASAIQNAQSHGVIFVAAAGNNGTDNDTTPEYPASYNYSNVVSVAATDQNNNLASFSDYGTTPSRSPLRASRS